MENEHIKTFQILLKLIKSNLQKRHIPITLKIIFIGKIRAEYHE